MPDPRDDHATAPPTVGETTSGGTRFRILRPHAKGGLGEVFVAADEELHREVALKQMQDRSAQDPASRARFLLEAEVTGGLEHPGIVPVYGLGTYADGRPFYAMRFIRGDSLKEAIERFHKKTTTDSTDYTDKKSDKSVLSVLSVVDFSSVDFRKLLGRFVDVCNAIQYAHDRGVLHRDLKPSNIMLGPYGETLVVDWGLAKAVGSRQEAEGSKNASDTLAMPEPVLIPQSGSGVAETQAGSAIGTPQYMSPEQAAGRLDLLGPASDVYSLGATLYCLLTGTAPFDVEDLGSLLRRVERGEFVPPRGRNPRIPRSLEAICLKAMARRTTDRYASPRQLADDVERWLANDPVRAWPEPWSVRTRRWTNKHRTLVSSLTAAILVLILGGGAAGLWYVNDQARREAEIHARSARVNTALSETLADADAILQDLEARLNDPAQAQVLFSDLPQWQALLARARLEEKEIRAIVLGNESLVDPELARRVQSTFAQVGAEGKNFRLANELDDIRMEAATLADGKFDPSKAGTKYAALFSRLGLDVLKEDPKSLANKITLSDLRFALVSSLDHWAEVATLRSSKDRDLLPRLLDIARTADPDPWRDRFRQVEAWTDPQKRLSLAAEVEHGKQSSPILVSLATRLPDAEALVLLRRSLVHHPRDFWLHFDLANRTKDVIERVAHFQAALTVRPDSAPTYSNLGNALLAQKDLAGAEAAYRKSIEIEPRFALAYNHLGNVFTDRKDLTAAEAAYRKAVELDPKLDIAHYNLGNVLHQRKDLSGALVSFRTALSLDSSDARFHAGFGNTLLDLKDMDGALDALRKAITLDPHFAMAHNDLGAALYARRSFAEAAGAFTKAIEIDPKLARAYHNLGLALRQQGKIREALQAASKGDELGWNESAKNVRLWQRLLPLADVEKAGVSIQAGQSPQLKGELRKDHPLDVHEPTAKSFRSSHLVRFSAGQAYQIDLRADFDPLLRLEDQVFQTLGLNDDVSPPGDLNSRLIVIAAKDENYRLVVTSYKPGAVGPYTLQIEAVSPIGEPHVFKGELSEPRDPNDESLAATLKGKLFQRHNVELTAGRPYVMELHSPRFDTFLILLDPAGKQLAENDDVNPDSRLSRLDFTPKTGGSYTLVVTTFGPGETGPYTLRVQGFGKDEKAKR